MSKLEEYCQCGCQKCPNYEALAAKDAEIAELREKLDQYANDVYEIASSGKEYHRFFLQQREVLRIHGYAFDGGNTGAIVSVYAKPMEPTAITKHKGEQE